MKEILINVSKETRMVDLNKPVIGNDGENLQGKLVFTFIDEFVDGQARLEYEIKGNKNYVVLDKKNNTYTIPVKNVITKEGQIDMQLVITEGTDEKEIPVFKSNKFYLFCNSSINAVDEAPEGYELWIEQANAKLNEIDEVLLETQTQSNYAKEQGNYAKEQATKVDEVVDYVVRTSEEAKENSDTAISISKGANQALDYLDYANMITNFNAFEKEKFNTGQNVMIKKLNVPDMWIYQLSEEYQNYTYTTDEEVISLLLSDNGFHVGYYKLSALETQKVDLTDYVKFNDYATYTKAGLIRPSDGLVIAGVNRDALVTLKATNEQIDAKENRHTPIVPYNLDYAVGSVKASETQRGSIKAWTSTNEDEEIGLNISTED